jgi:hypothetical protein
LSFQINFGPLLALIKRFVFRTNHWRDKSVLLTIIHGALTQLVCKRSRVARFSHVPILTSNGADPDPCLILMPFVAGNTNDFVLDEMKVRGQNLFAKFADSEQFGVHWTKKSESFVLAVLCSRWRIMRSLPLPVHVTTTCEATPSDPSSLLCALLCRHAGRPDGCGRGALAAQDAQTRQL